VLFDKVDKRRIITFYFKTKTVDVCECKQPQLHQSKQHNKVVIPQERLLSIIQVFCQGASSFASFANEVPIYKVFYYLPLNLFH